MRAAIALICLLAVIPACSANRKLSDKDAEATARALIAEMHDPKIGSMTWKGLTQISETEYRGNATLELAQTDMRGQRVQRFFPIQGTFTYHKTTDGWALDYADFANPEYFGVSLQGKVFRKVGAPTQSPPAPALASDAAEGKQTSTPAAASSTPAAALPTGTDAFKMDGADEPLSIAAARKAATDKIASMPLEEEGWTVSNFGGLTVDAGMVFLPATLTVETSEGKFPYNGGFYFNYTGNAAGFRKWLLSAMWFKSDGRPDITQQFQTPTVVQ